MSAAIATPASSPWDVTPEDLAAARTPIWDALYAEQDAETQRVVFNACADEHTEPVAVPTSFILIENKVSVAQADAIKALAKDGDIEPAAVVAALTKPRKKPAAKNPAAKSPLAAQEAKLRTVRGRLADEFKTLGGNDAGAVNELGVAFVCLLGLLLAPVIVAVFG